MNGTQTPKKEFDGQNGALSLSQARGLVRAATHATLSTLSDEAAGQPGWPYGSLVNGACGQDAAPILLLSDLADHAKNIAADDRLSLLYLEEIGSIDREASEDILTRPRLTVMGRAVKLNAEEGENALLCERFIRRHPSARDYANFTDFNFYKVEVEKAYLVAGFGKVRRIKGRNFLCDKGTGEMRGAESSMVDHMNVDHADAIGDYATALAGRAEKEGWTMTGIDPEGFDLRRGAQTARIAFENPLTTRQELRQELVRLAEIAHQKG